MNNNYSYISPFISKLLEEMEARDFRVKKTTYNSLALRFKEYWEWKQSNLQLLATQEFARSLLNAKNGVSIKNMIIILQQFSNADSNTQRNVIMNLAENDKFLRCEIRLKRTHSRMLELDMDHSLLFLKSTGKDSRSEDVCYQ